MALRSIRTEGDDVLRKTSKKVEDFNQRLKLLVGDMFDTMYDASGVGLAAPQIGVLKRVFVVDTGEEGQKQVFINPEILESSEEMTYMPEGCLSIPGKQGMVSRPQRVVVRAQDENGETFELVAEDFYAKAISHENDHLNGVLYCDKVEEWLEMEPEEEE